MGRLLGIFAGTALAAFALDWGTKGLARAAGWPILLNNASRPAWLIALVLVIGVGATLVTRMTVIAVVAGLSSGGALGNIFERVCFGSATDFIPLGRGGYANIADLFACFSVPAMLLYIAYSERRHQWLPYLLGAILAVGFSVVRLTVLADQVDV